MKTSNLNWIPNDVYGNTWKLVYFIEKNNQSNFAYFILAEIRNFKNSVWKWKVFVNKTDHYPIKKNWGYVDNKAIAIKMVTEYIK